MIPAWLEDFILERMIASRIPGLSAVFLSEGDLQERHFGFRSLAHRSPPDGDTRYGLGSVTKLFTAIAVLRLAESGEISLEAPVDRALAELAGRFPPGARVRHLLAHTSGMPALGFSESKMSDAWYMDGYPVGGWPDVVTFLQGAEDWWTDEPGSRWQYSNEGYLALGALIERATGEAYAEHVDRTLLQPLGMSRSTFDRTAVESDPNRVTPLMQDDEGRFVEGSNLYGPVPAAGGLVSTARDMASFARCLMGEGASPDAGRVFGVDTAHWLRDIQVGIDPESATPLDDVGVYDDPVRHQAVGAQAVLGIPGVPGGAYGHGGGVMGGTSYVLVAPEQRLGVVLLANTHGYPLARLALVALAGLAGQSPESLAFVRRERVSRDLAGEYRAFRGTMRAELRPSASGMELRIDFRPVPRTVPLVLLEHDEGRGVTNFLALGQGRPARAQVVRPADPSAPLELRYERYAFRRTGRSAS